MDNTPIFVKIDEYKEILKVVDVINEKVGTIKQSLTELKSIKEKEDEHIQKWNSQLDNLSGKMKFVNQTLKEM